MRVQAAGPASSLPSCRLAGGRSPPRGCALSEHPAQSWGRGRGLRPLLGGATAARPAGPAPRPLRPSLGLSGHIWTHVSLSSCGAGGGTRLHSHDSLWVCPLPFDLCLRLWISIPPNQAYPGSESCEAAEGREDWAGQGPLPLPWEHPPLRLVGGGLCTPGCPTLRTGLSVLSLTEDRQVMAEGSPPHSPPRAAASRCASLWGEWTPTLRRGNRTRRPRAGAFASRGVPRRPGPPSAERCGGRAQNRWLAQVAPPTSPRPESFLPHCALPEARDCPQTPTATRLGLHPFPEKLHTQ